MKHIPLHHHLNPILLARKKDKKYDTLAYVIIFVTLFFSIPQVIQIYETKSAEDVSFITWIGNTGIGVFWLIYGIERKLHPIVLSSLFHLVVNIVMVYGISQYGNVL